MTLRARKRRLFFGGSSRLLSSSDDGVGSEHNDGKPGGSGSSSLPLFRQLSLITQNPVTSMMIRTTGKPLLLLLLCIIPFGYFVATQEGGGSGGIGKRINIVDYCDSSKNSKEQQRPSIKEPIWEWHYYSNQTTPMTPTMTSGTTSTGKSRQRSMFQQESTTRKRLLIVQYAGHGRLLTMTSKINQQYAKLWKHDYVLIQGNLLQQQQQQQLGQPTITCELPTSYSHWNKLIILQQLMDDNDKKLTNTVKMKSSIIYDQILILDETSMLYDIERDVTTLLGFDNDNNKYMVAATRVYRKRRSSFLPTFGFSKSTRTWEFNIMLWNLHHPKTKDVIQEWYKRSTTKTNQINYVNDANDHVYTYDDQWILHDIVTTKGDEYKSQIRTLEVGFTDKDINKPMVQHFNQYPIDYEGNWNVIDKAIGEVCQRSPPNGINCNDLCTSNVPRRQAEYEWHITNNNNETSKTSNNGIGNKKDTRKLLIAQYSAYGSYARLLELTSPINKAYAKLWNSDYVILQGSSISIYPRDYWCNPPQERSRFNKISLLQLALSKRNEYDMLLLLDADAMIYDFSKDIRSYIPNGDDTTMLVAHRVNANEGIHSWDINNGVTLWNLHSKMQVRAGDVISE